MSGTIPEIPAWLRCAGFDVGVIDSAPKYGELSPKQKAELSHIRTSMAVYTEAELLSMVKIGMKASIALELCKPNPNVDPDQVDFACR